MVTIRWADDHERTAVQEDTEVNHGDPKASIAGSFFEESMLGLMRNLSPSEEDPEMVNGTKQSRR